jgi:hypothetical protein
MLICGVVALHASPLGLLLSGAGFATLVTGVFGLGRFTGAASRDANGPRKRTSPHCEAVGFHAL